MNKKDILILFVSYLRFIKLPAAASYTRHKPHHGQLVEGFAEPLHALLAEVLATSQSHGGLLAVEQLLQSHARPFAGEERIAVGTLIFGP